MQPATGTDESLIKRGRRVTFKGTSPFIFPRVSEQRGRFISADAYRVAIAIQVLLSGWIRLIVRLSPRVKEKLNRALTDRERYFVERVRGNAFACEEAGLMDRPLVTTL